jgi:hypothetical protein
MPLNVVATTTSALAAGVLRFERAGQRVTAAAAPAADPAGGAAESGDLEPGVFAVYDARGRMTTRGSPDAMVDAVGELLRAQTDVNVDAAMLRRAWHVQGALLDVLA